MLDIDAAFSDIKEALIEIIEQKVEDILESPDLMEKIVEIREDNEKKGIEYKDICEGKGGLI